MLPAALADANGTAQTKFVLGQAMNVGGVRLRQVCTDPDTCTVPSMWESKIPTWLTRQRQAGERSVKKCSIKTRSIPT